MANTYTQIYLHIVFVVEGRQNLIPKQHQMELYSYIAGIINEKKHKSFIVNGMPDHIHILLGYHPIESLSSLVKEIKRCSSMFINKSEWIVGKFDWQTGYAAFSYSKSHVDTVYKYIENQKTHHSKRTFMEEYIELLKKYEIPYDERYIFKDLSEE